MNKQPETHFLKALFSRLKQFGVQYAVMRNYQSLPLTVNGSDLDILIKPGCEAVAKSALMRAVEDANGAVIGIAATEGFFKFNAFGRPSEYSNAWWGLRIDVSVGLKFRGCANLLSESVLQERIIYHHGIPVLPPDLAAIIGVLKEVLYNGLIDHRYLPDAISAIQGNREQVFQDLAPMGHSAIHELIILCRKSENQSLSPKTISRIRKRLLYHAFRTSPLGFLKSRLKFSYSKVQRIFHPPGIVIAFLGTDGSGKSTLIKAITPTLESATHGDLFIRHLRPKLLPPLSQLKSQTIDSSTAVMEPQKDPPSGVLGSLVRISYLSADYILGYWISIRPIISRSPAVQIFDRYAYDLLIDQRRLKINLPRWIVRSFLAGVPRPDLTICLSGDPHAIYERKKELSITEVSRQINELNKFANTTMNTVLIFTDRSIGEAKTAILEAILKTCNQRGNPLI